MANLEFQPFQDGFTVNLTNEQSGGFSGNIGDKPRESLVNDADTLTSSKKSIFSFSFFQQFFDVETDQVVKRLINSVVPTGNNFILDFVQPVPDLWGPLWVSITLVFSIGIFGNIAQYIENDGKTGSYGSDFRLVTSAATLIFCYVVFVPLVVFAVLWNRKSDLIYPYVDLLCAFGYSLTVFIPVSFLWVMNINWLRWALIFVAVSLSGGVLAKSIYPAFKNDSNRIVAFGSVATILFLHFLLAFTFKEFFFDAVHPIKDAVTVAPPEVSVGGGGVPSQVQMSETVLPPAALVSTLPANTTSSSSPTTTTTILTTGSATILPTNASIVATTINEKPQSTVNETTIATNPTNATIVESSSSSNPPDTNTGSPKSGST